MNMKISRCGLGWQISPQWLMLVSGCTQPVSSAENSFVHSMKAQHKHAVRMFINASSHTFTTYRFVILDLLNK